MQATRLPPASLNHSAPSRTTMESGRLPGVMPARNSVTRPSGVMRAMQSASPSENQILLSGPRAMPSGPELAVGSAYSTIAPDKLMHPTRLPAFSVNQSFPSAPADRHAVGGREREF